MYVCICKGLTESEVREVAQCQAQSPEALVDAIGWNDGVCCGRCASTVDRIFSFVTRDDGRTMVASPLSVAS